MLCSQQTSECRKKKFALSDVVHDHEWLLVPDRLGGVFHKTADVLGFSLTTLETQNDAKKQKQKQKPKSSVSSNSVGGNVADGSSLRKIARLAQADRKAMATEITPSLQAW